MFLRVSAQKHRLTEVANSRIRQWHNQRLHRMSPQVSQK
nr:MAG TPA: hypothetical protein [Herelleviridae sp.]